MPFWGKRENEPVYYQVIYSRMIDKTDMRSDLFWLKVW